MKRKEKKAQVAIWRLASYIYSWNQTNRIQKGVLCQLGELLTFGKRKRLTYELHLDPQWLASQCVPIIKPWRKALINHHLFTYYVLLQGRWALTIHTPSYIDSLKPVQRKRENLENLYGFKDKTVPFIPSQWLQSKPDSFLLFSQGIKSSKQSLMQESFPSSINSFHKYW